MPIPMPQFQENYTVYSNSRNDKFGAWAVYVHLYSVLSLLHSFLLRLQVWEFSDIVTRCHTRLKKKIFNIRCVFHRQFGYQVKENTMPQLLHPLHNHDISDFANVSLLVLDTR